MSEFHLRGAIPISSDAYVERAFENKIFEHVVTGRWVLFLGPRQHGKSTCLLRLKGKLMDSGISCALIDLQGQPPFDSFDQFLSWVAHRIAKNLGIALDVQPEVESPQQFDSWLEICVPSNIEPIVIIIDEASLIDNEVWRNSFYGQIRAMANEDTSSQPERIAGRVRFVFAGCFRPESLVNNLNSPFNVCERVDTEDFLQEEIEQLHSKVTRLHDEKLVSEVYRFVGGQPYLVQLLLTKAQEEPDNHLEAVSMAVDCLRSGEDDHFQGVFSQIVSDDKLSNLVYIVARDGSIPNEAANADYKYLQVLGVVKRSGANLIFRNTLYSEFARGSSQIMQGAPVVEKSSALIVPSPDAFSFMTSGELKEIALTMEIGAVKAHNAGNYRLALAGFGAAFESVLIDFLSNLGPADLQTAVNAARDEAVNPAEFGTNSQTKPTKFTLANLIKVARKVSNTIRIIDPPDSLREWRNLIHPGVAIKNYRAESVLEPESRAASGLLASCRREIGSRP